MLAALLAGLAVLLAIQAFIVYLIISCESPASYVAFYVAFVLTSLASLAGRLLRRRPGGAGWYWYSAGLVAAATGRLAVVLAGHLGWGHPLPFALISDCGYAVCAACISVAGAIVIRSARRDRRPGMQERSDREQFTRAR